MDFHLCPTTLCPTLGIWHLGLILTPGDSFLPKLSPLTKNVTVDTIHHLQLHSPNVDV